MRKLRTVEMRRLSLEDFHQAEKLPLIVVPPLLPTQKYTRPPWEPRTA